MHLLRFGKPAFLLALFTKRVCIHVSVTDSLPCPAIFSFDGRVSIIFFIPFIFQPLMFLTESAIRQLWTAGIGTRPFRFPRHFATSLGHKKSPHRIAPVKAVFVFYFAIVMISQDGCVTLCQTVPTFNPGQKNSGELTRVCGVPCEATRSASGISPPRSSCPGNGNGVPAAPRGWQACRLLH